MFSLWPGRAPHRHPSVRAHGLRSGSEEYKRAHDASKLFDRKSGGPAADLDALMEAFRSFLTSMAGGDKETVAQTIKREVRRMVEDMLVGEPYRPKLLMRLLTIKDMPPGLL